MHTLYSLGYAGWSAEQVRLVAEERSALVLDLRLTPQSRKPGFSKRTLERYLGERYVHVRALGNVNYRTGGPIVLRDAGQGLAILSQHLRHRAVILLCGCADLHACHRKTVADLAAGRFGAEVVHLAPSSSGATT